MKIKEDTKQGGIINTYNMEKFFDKESLINIMYTLKKAADIDELKLRQVSGSADCCRR